MLDTNSVCPRRAWGWPIPSPPTPLRVTPSASLLQGGGAPPGCAKAHVTPTHLPCAGLVEASWRLWLLRQLNTPAGRQLAPFVSAGQSPRCLPRPAQLRAPLPQVPQDLVQGGGQENPRADSPTLESPKGVGSAGEGRETGDEGWRGLGKKGRGTWWRGGEASGLRYANSQEDRVGPPPHEAPKRSGPAEVASEQAPGLGVPG